jgi:mono/diheme cytochrome c family protein
MTSRLMGARSCLALGVLVAVVWAAPTGSVRVAAQDAGTEAQRESGKKLYLKYCSQCHGDKGDGAGYAAPHLLPRPRDFTSAKFKVRTTPNGALPTHQDLVNIIRRGMPYTSMPAWPDLSDAQISDLAYFVQTFSPDFASREKVPQTVPLPSGPGATKETIAQGKKLYEDTGCARCHGNLGRGDGPSAPTLKDDFDHPIRPADLSQPWTFRGGSSREDIFRTMSTGFNGTPMPAFVDGLSPEQRWAIADYIVSLPGSDGPGYTNLVIAKPVREAIDLKKGAASFASAPAARLPIIGQIMEPGRAFSPPATSVTVQAIYDADSIALLVRWHDRSAEKTGQNGPSLPVPIEEEEPAATKPAGDNPFGDAEVAPGAAQPAAQDPFADASAPAAPPSEFSDAVSIQVPAEAPTGARKPYFIFGDSQAAVDLWFFDLAQAAPAQFTGKGSASITPAEATDLTGVASYDQGEWSVIFKRPRRPAAGAPFTPGEFLPIAFSVWDGFSRERGNRRGLSLWYSIYLEPENVPSPAGPMITTAGSLLAIELAVIGFVRWRRARDRDEPGGEQKQAPAASV